MSIVKIAAFSDGDIGGNPAGVYISEQNPAAEKMQAIAADVGFSETAFAEPIANGQEDGAENHWRVRYFSPESEVPFCGHATIALGAALTQRNGPGTYTLALNEATISVEGFQQAGTYSAALQSPSTESKPADPAMLSAALNLFGFEASDLDPAIAPAFANAGANHLILAVNSREKLANMHYDLNAGREFMQGADLVTVMLVYAESDQLFHSRNAFASGGVYEDPATGAASAAFAAYLRDIAWPHGGAIDIVQGEDMGSRSLIRAALSDVPGSSVRVSGAARFME